MGDLANPCLVPPLQKITVADIAKFEEEYKGSEEELADLKAAYLDGDGDMNYIMDNVLCAVQGYNSRKDVPEPVLHRA